MIDHVERDARGSMGCPPVQEGHCGICKSRSRMEPRDGNQSTPSFQLPALMEAWVIEFGERPIRASALIHRAKSSAELAGALGRPMPSARSLGRLLAKRDGHLSGRLMLVRCWGRHDNCALWQVRAHNDHSAR